MRVASYVQDASLDAPGDRVTYLRSHKRSHTVIVRQRFQCEVALIKEWVVTLHEKSHRTRYPRNAFRVCHVERKRERRIRSFMLRMARLTGDFVRNRPSSAIVSLWIRNKRADTIVRFVVLEHIYVRKIFAFRSDEYLRI